MGFLNKQTFICLDCEMTGLDLEQDRIIEVAVVKFTFDEILEEYETLIDPECSIPQTSIDIHHITQEMVTGKPTIDKVIPRLLELINKHIVVGHGVNFDLALISKAADRAGIPHKLLNNRSFDTLRMARLYGESPTNSLEQLRKHFNIEEEGAHRAMSDVIVNVGVFKYLAKNYKTTDQLFDVLSRPILLKAMPLGKHKGRLMKEIPVEYLRWAVTKDFDQDLIFTLRTELKKRKSGNQFGQSGNPFSNL
jgi:DNA polymerase-3 subunit epsilon